MPDQDDSNLTGTVDPNAVPQKKSKRVRTGCLTCRERHLKCDEGLPNCQNCCKSNRVCKRGVRLNFIDTQVQAPPVVPRANEWMVNFLDESRDIASEYKGGLSRYGLSERENVPNASMHNTNSITDINDVQPSLAFDFSTSVSAAPITTQQQQQQQQQPQPQALPPIHGVLPDPYNEDPQFTYEAPREPQHHHNQSLTDTSYSGSNLQHTPATAYSNPERQPSPREEARDYLTTQEEVFFMQVFVEEVGLWMDSMDPQKHFSRLLPFHALGEPMLLNAFLACGARHVALVNPKYTEDKPLHYYDTATRYLLNSLQNPNRDTVICATTAVILNVYEIMCERALQRMNHIAGARALIKECGWNARSTGVGSACFWLNVGMELLSCLHFNWQVAWDPDDWGVDMEFSRETDSGKEEIWTHRIVYIVAKICNFRASIPRFQEASPRDEQIRLESRYKEWLKLKAWCDTWNDNIPRTMHPIAYLYPGQTSSGSAFPEVWLIKRTTVVARLFYHTALVLLAQINPLMSVDTDEMQELQNRHSQQICGIVAHVKDRGVASVALRSLAIAAECLTNRREQEEVLQIFTKIRQETGWNVNFVYKELKQKWGWNNPSANPPPQPQPQQLPAAATVTHNPSPQAQIRAAPAPQQVPLRTYQPAPQTQTTNIPLTLQPAATLAPSPPTRRPMPTGILNPLLATADFGMPQHPYQNYYVAPNPLGQGGGHYTGGY